MMLIMALVMVFGGIVAMPEKASAGGQTKRISFEKKIIQDTGWQGNNGWCMGYSYAYCHAINTGKKQNVHNFLTPKGLGTPGVSNYGDKWFNTPVQALAFVHDEIDRGRPCIIYVTQLTGSEHFVCVYGYINVTDKNKMTLNNLMIIESVAAYSNHFREGKAVTTDLKEMRINAKYGKYRVSYYLGGPGPNPTPTPVVQHKTGTYKVGPTFAGMTEGRVVREAKNDKSKILANCAANTLVYVKETYPNDNWAKVEYKLNNKPYTGYMWIAAKANKQALDFVSANDITPKAITSAPVVSVSSDKAVAVGKTVSFKWGSVANADKYTVTLKQGNNVISTKTISGTSWSCALNSVGTYSFTVQAKNDVFWSGVSNAVSVQAYQNVKVTFKDYDGKILSEQTISYGGNAKQPVTPSGRVGYTFRGWDKSYQNVKSNTVITALYDINKYSVRFYDGNGKQIGNTQTIEHGKTAIAPANENVAVKSGYTFVKWDKQFDKITQNTNVYAVTTWENPNLPIKILDGATALQQVEDTVVSSYKVDMKLRNINTEDTTGRAIVALKTSDGNLLTATESNAFTVKNGVDSAISVTVPYTGQATRAEIYIVNGYQYTSNNFEVGTIPISQKVSVACERYENSLAVSEWSTEKPPADAVGVEQKKQYSSRSITNSVKYKHIYYPNSWSSYTTTVLTASSTRKVTSKKQYQYRDVGAWGSEQSTTTKPTESTLLTITGSSTAYYYYHYCNVYANGSAGVDSVASGSGNGDTIKKNYGKCVYKRSSALTSTANYGDIGGKTQYIVSTGCSQLSGVTSHSGNCGNPGWKLWYFDKSVTTYKYKTRAWGSYSAWQDAAVSASSTRQVNTRTVYAYKDAVAFYDNNPTGVARSGYTYDSSSVSESNKVYGNWGAWQDEAITANSSTDVQTRTVYRWKTREEITTGDVIDGKTKIVSGNVPEEFAGREAILFVYKNSDASDYTTEYIGQTKIGTDGGFRFEFMTREEPSKETGDFSATLGIEGTDVVFQLDESNYDDPDQFKAPMSEFTVEFVDKDGNLLTTQKVKEGEAAILPEEIPEVEGYTFVGWNTNVANIKSDYTVDAGNPIRAEYEINKYDVIYIDWSSNQVETRTFEHGSALTAPETIDVDSSKEGYEKKWSASFDGNVFVTKDMIVTCEENTKKFKVTYYDLANEVIASENVTYGDKIILPDASSLSTDTMIVVGWKTDDETQLNKVTKDVNLYPDYMYYDSVVSPSVNVPSGSYNEKQSITFGADNVDDDIYYTVDGSDPKENGILFNYPISVEKTTKIRVYAKRDGANDSYESTYYYVINKAEDTGSDWCKYEELPEEVVNNQERYRLESKTGYRYSITKQVMSDEEATALAQSGWTQVGSTAYTAWTDYMDELPEGIGEAEIDEKTDDEGQKQYRYRYAIWTYRGYSAWQLDVPNVANYETETVYRYHSPKQCLLTISAYGEDDRTLFVYSGEKLDINPSDYLREGEVFKGLYRNDDFTDQWMLDEDVISGDTILYLDKEKIVCNLRYYGFNDELITEKEIYYGEDAEDIEPPVVEGYVFIGWDKELTNIKQDTDFHANYIVAAEARKLSLNLAKKSVFTQSSFILTASVDGEDSVTDVEWSSANDNIASVDDGVVTGKHAGTTKITAKLSTGERVTCDVTVVGDEDYELLLKQISQLTVNREKNVITLNSPAMVSSIKEEFVNTIQAFDSNDTELDDEDILSTNCSVNGTNVDDRLSIVVLGDLNEDKTIDDEDIEFIENIVYMGYDEEDVGTAVYMAADMTQDGIVDSNDIEKLEDVIAGKVEVTIDVKNPEYGSASGSGKYLIGSSAQLKATVNDGGKFVGWFDTKGALLSDKTEYVLTVMAETNIVAMFEKMPVNNDNTSQINPVDPSKDLKGTTPSTEELKPAEVGLELKAENAKATFKVTSSDPTTPTVAYSESTNKKAKNITIPQTVVVDNITYKVTSIDDKAFAGNKNLKSVTIGSDVEKIGARAFDGCKNLKTIIIKSKKLTKKSFGKNAFKGVNKKVTFHIPKKVYKNYKKWIKKAGAPKTANYKKK
jgi:hypothetical protein